MRLVDDARDMLMTSQHLFERSTTIKPPDSPRKTGHIHYELKEPNLASFSCPSMWHCFLSWKQTIERAVDFKTSTVSVFTTAAEELIRAVVLWILPQQDDGFMSLFDTRRSSLHKLRSVVIAVLILNSYEHTHPWRFDLISPSHPCSDVKQHFDPGEHVVAGWVVPACKEQNLQICFVFSHSQTVIRLLPIQKTTAWPWKTSTCIYLNVAFAFKCNPHENAEFVWERDCI